MTSPRLIELQPDVADHTGRPEHEENSTFLWPELEHHLHIAPSRLHIPVLSDKWPNG